MAGVEVENVRHEVVVGRIHVEKLRSSHIHMKKKCRVYTMIYHVKTKVRMKKSWNYEVVNRIQNGGMGTPIA